MTSADLLLACRLLAERLELAGAEMVEVIPTAVGSADITALRRGPHRPRDRHRHRPAPRLGARRCEATIVSTSGAYLEMKLLPTPLIAARPAASEGRVAAIATSVLLWATV